MDYERLEVRVNELWIILFGFLLRWLLCFQLEYWYLALCSRGFCSLQTVGSCYSKQFLIKEEEKEI